MSVQITAMGLVLAEEMTLVNGTVPVSLDSEELAVI